ncbi:MAG: hypothetical protein U5R46_01285 [Gammaproteobacteria bacterium]|nr:hypothetical protein [Gammaproteobacteria bacterium]
MNPVKSVLLKSLGLAMLACLPAAVAAAPGRVLLEDPAFHATVSSATDCRGPIDLMLVTPDPALLDSDTRDVQRIVDASLAVIRFQCPDIARVTVRGSLQGDTRETFVADAERSNNWLVKPERTFRLQVPADTTDINRTGAQPAMQGPVLVVAGLEPGMSLDAARKAMASSFNTEPRLLDGGTRLVVEGDGCRAGSSWQTRFGGAVPGSRCVEAWFTDVRYPRLYRVEYAEVVTARQSREATTSLVRRYGEPLVRENSAVYRDGRHATHLAWGTAQTVDGKLRHPLQATVGPFREITVLAISLYDMTPARVSERSFRY